VRVLLLSEFYPPVVGGLEFHVQALALGLQDAGHEVEVATLSLGPTLDNGIRIHHLSSTTSRVPRLHQSPVRPFHPPCPDPAIRRQLARILASSEPDLIHAHNWLAASVPRRHRAPLVLTAHDFSLTCARRDLFYRDRTICQGPSLGKCMECSIANFGPIRGPVIAGLTPIGLKALRPDGVITVSKVVADRIRGVLEVDPYVVPNFISSSLPGATVSTEGLPPEPFVMFAGASEPAKGIDVLLRAWDDGLGIPAPLVLALLPGHKPLPRPTRATVLYLSREQVLSAWRRAAVAIVPSLWQEPCPTVVLEAMSVGTPVIASDVGGIGELMTNGVEGLLVRPGDVLQLRTEVTRLLASPSLRTAMGEAGRVRAQSYTSAQIIPAIEDVYSRVLQARERSQ
jgi:glycosyltransferase involved in cell wall biosynthesis